MTSSDLSRYYDQSSWFFRKAVAERSRQPVLCVAPGGYDKLIVVRGVDYVLAEIKSVISEVRTHIFYFKSVRPKNLRIKLIHLFKTLVYDWCRSICTIS